GRRGAAEGEGGARRRVDLVAMVHLEDLDVVIGAEPAGDGLDEIGEQGHRQAHIGAHMMGACCAACLTAWVCAASSPVVPMTRARPSEAARAAWATLAPGTVKSMT